MSVFSPGVFEGAGHWINRQTEGDYSVRYAIDCPGDGSTHHAVRREFFTADGASLYVEETTVSFMAAARNGMTVVITGPKGSVTGSGYVFGNQCHYEADVAPGTRLEFTVTVGSGRIEGLASSTTRDNVTSWRETLTEVAPPAAPEVEESQPLP